MLKIIFAAIALAAGLRSLSFGQPRGAIEQAAAADAVKDYQKELAILRAAATSGDAEAQYQLGLMYANGKGAKKNSAEAFRWYKKAAQGGSVAAQYYAGLNYLLLSRQSSEGLRWLNRAADGGYAPAMTFMGAAYHQGKFVPQDFSKARQWYLKAAKSRSASAMVNLGVMYESGQGVRKDFATALRWYVLGRSNGDPQAPRLADNLSSKMPPEQAKAVEAAALSEMSGP